MKKLLAVLLAIFLIVPILPFSAAQYTVSAASIGNNRQIVVNQTGVYTISPTGSYTGTISVYDNQGNKVIHNEKLGGFPLVKNATYKLNAGNTSTVFNVNLVSNKIFSDVPSSEWYNDAVAYAVGRGIISGYGGTTKFGPGDSIQRQDFMVILAKFEGVDLTEYGNKSTNFGDVPEDSYYEAAINWGYENSIVSGYANGYFGTGDKITREQLVKFLYNYATYKGLDTNYKPITKNETKENFTDYNQISSWALDSVLWAKERGIISGKTKSSLAPAGNALRCEVAQIIYNIFTNNIFDDTDSLVGTKIIFASTIDPRDDGTDYVVSQFEREYGIEVEIIVPTLENYGAEMQALIAAGMAPTVGRSAGDAPIYVGYFQSLDAAGIDYTDEIWDQRMFELSTYNGSPYLCNTVGNFWTEMDIVVYSKSLLKKAIVPTPEELDMAGIWTWDSYLEIGKKTAQIDGCSGATFSSYDTLLHMAGGAVYRPDSNNYMTNGINNDTVEIFQKIAQGFKDNYITMGGTRAIINGTSAISTTKLWSLRRDGNFMTHPKYNDLGFYYLPSFEEGGERYVTGELRGWGIFKGCNENPATGSKAAKAGGLFLREYLDVNNYALNSSFLTEEAKTFFFECCYEYINTDNYNPYYTTYSLNEGVSGIDDDRDVYNIMTYDPAQIALMLRTAKSVVDLGCKNLNNYIDNQININ